MQSAAVAEDRIFQALADPSRRAIFVSLTRGEAAVKDLTARFDISQPAVSQHLRVLKDAGLVFDIKAGTRRLYQLNPEGVARLRAHFDQMWTQAMGAFQKAAEKDPGKGKHGRHSGRIGRT